MRPSEATSGSARRSRGTRYLARARWTHPDTHKREETSATFGSDEEAQGWIDDMAYIARTGVDRGQNLATYLESIGDRWARSIDPNSTYDPYVAGLRKRVLPTLGHIPVGMITAGLIDRAIDSWETAYGASTVRNTVAGLVLVLDQAVRDELLPRNPAKDRAQRRSVGRAADATEEVSPRDLALHDVVALNLLVAAVAKAGRHQSWGDTVTLLATTAMRISEVAGLTAGDVDLCGGVIRMTKQT